MPRRRFLAALGMPAVVGLASPAPVKAPAPLAFSTLGCPRWDWRTIRAQASAMGYAGIEVRGIQDELDLTRCPPFQPASVATTLKELDAAGLHIVGLGSSVKLHESDPGVRWAELDSGRRYIDLAHRLQAPYVRVFGDRIDPARPRETSVERVVDGLRVLGRHAAGSQVTVLIESHGDFTDSPTLAAILREVSLPQVALLWDAHHTVVAGKESPAQTWQRIGPYVRHVHLKDSRPEGKDVHYVLTGAGTVPVRDTVRLLAANGYPGFYSFEWEKRWHPELEEPEIAFPQFALVMTEYLSSSRP